MAELRKDYVLNRYVIIATERAKRPDQFKGSSAENEEKKCFFCPGHEDETPAEITRIGENEWSMRVFENKFPAVGKEGKTDIETHNEFFTFAGAVGRHEIIVETPDHHEQLWDFDSERIKQLLELYVERIGELKKDNAYVQIFKNHGKEGGASVQHSHTQIIAGNMPPAEIIEKEEKSDDSCLYCQMMEKEKDSTRSINEDDKFLVFSPYASRFLFETWLFPKRHVTSIEELDEDELQSLANNIHNLLKKLKELNAPYNLYLQEGTDKMHFHVVLAPRLAMWAGYEMATGTVINPVPPENAAEFYRESD